MSARKRVKRAGGKPGPAPVSGDARDEGTREPEAPVAELESGGDQGSAQTGAVITEARPAEETLRETEQPAKAVPDVGEGEPLIGTPSSKARHFAMPSSDGNPA